MVKWGVIDPAKVTRLALQNAASIAGLMLTTEALVAELKEDGKKSAAAGGPGGPGGGMGGMYQPLLIKSNNKKSVPVVQNNAPFLFEFQRPNNVVINVGNTGRYEI